MSDEPIPLAVIADFLEHRGHPGPAAAVRTLEWLVASEILSTLDHAILSACAELRKSREDYMVHALCDRMAELGHRKSIGPPGLRHWDRPGAIKKPPADPGGTTGGNE